MANRITEKNKWFYGIVWIIISVVFFVLFFVTLGSVQTFLSVLFPILGIIMLIAGIACIKIKNN